MWGIFGKPLKSYLGYPGSACCTDNMYENFVHFGRCVCCLLPLFVNRQLPCLHTNSRNVLLLPPMHHRKDKIKWLDFGQTPDPENSEPHPGFIWVKSGYSEAIAWCKVQLTKQQNVDLTTDGLWAMPLNTGWVPVKACRLHAGLGKIEEICSQSQAGGCVPQWSPSPCG